MSNMKVQSLRGHESQVNVGLSVTDVNYWSLLWSFSETEPSTEVLTSCLEEKFQSKSKNFGAQTPRFSEPIEACSLLSPTIILNFYDYLVTASYSAQLSVVFSVSVIPGTCWLNLMHLLSTALLCRNDENICTDKDVQLSLILVTAF